jgi:hypothetical protein
LVCRPWTTASPSDGLYSDPSLVRSNRRCNTPQSNGSHIMVKDRHTEPADALASSVQTTTKKRRRWLQFSLRTAFVLLTIFCVVLGITLNRARTRRAAIRAIDELGGTYGIRIEGPKWVRDLVKDDKYFYNATRISFGPLNQGYDPRRPFTDDELAHVIDHINAFSRFHTLDLRGSKVTDDGLKELRRLHRLENLWLTETGITDAGTIHLEALKTLKEIDFTGTNVTKEGVSGLRRALPDCNIKLSRK